MKPSSPLAPGHMLDGRYKVNKVIGVGGMGRVYLANDSRLASRPVAVKEMVVGNGVQERKAIEDFAREARVLALLSHPGIPNLIDYFVEQGRHYLVMEFVAGADLQGLLDKLGSGARLPEAEVLKWARQLLEVLDFLHGQKPSIVYRDLKPGNIMIDHHGNALLIDFGIARFLPPGGRGTQIGSVGYAPPEQYTGKVEPRSDLYSLAATMHHLLTGRDPQLEPPFTFPPLRSLAPQVSRQTADVVMRALEKDVEKRPRSAKEMLRALPELRESQLAGSLGKLGELGSANLAAPPALAWMRTIVLPQSAAPASQAAAEHDLAALIRGPTQPSLRLKPLPLSQPKPARVSATEKTQDLKGKASAEAPPRGARLIAVSRAQPGAPKAGLQPQLGAQTVVTPAAASREVTGAQNFPGAPGASASLLADGFRFTLLGSRIVIGRAERPTDRVDVDLSRVKRAAERVSRRHAEIIKRGSDYFIRDLGSLNGTYIAGRGRLGRDQLYKLRDRDHVVFGGAKLEFRKG